MLEDVPYPSQSFDATKTRAAELQAVLNPGTPKDRKDQADYFFFSETMKCLQGYKRLDPPTRPAGIPGPDQLAEGVARVSADRADAPLKASISLWGKFRHQVLQVEAENASRQEALISQYRKGSRLLEANPKDQELSGQVDQLDAFIRSKFHVKPDVKCDPHELRRLAIIRTREYGVLPHWMRDPSREAEPERGLSPIGW